MIRFKAHRLRRLAALALAAALPAVAQLPVVPGEPALGPKDAPVAQLRIESKVEAAPSLRLHARLQPVAPSEIAALRRVNDGQILSGRLKRLAIGIVREPQYTPPLPSAPKLHWIKIPGGYAAQFSITSPDAAALRVSMALAGVPANVQLVFFGADGPSRLLGPVNVGDIADRTSPWWSPVTEGQTQTVELFSPGERDPGSLPLRAVAVSHLLTGPSSGFAKVSSMCTDVGCAGACNVDLSCSSLESSPPFVEASNAVAKMVFNDGGATFLCTGTLLNDTDASTQIPWFFGANHCFDNDSPPFKTTGEMQAVASTLQTYWFFQSSSCNSGVVSSAYRQLFNGSTYIYNDPSLDVLFLRLNGTPPQGAFFSGWDANPLQPGNLVIDVHHPLGDLKKVSQGSVLGFTTPSASPGTFATNQFVGIHWSSGTTEGGSSGSAILTLGQFGGQPQYLVRGALWGGFASCDNQSGTDIFSRLDRAYPALANYLSPRNAPAFDYTDLWWNPAHPGWGLNITQHASHVLFAVWYTYDANGKRVWYSMSEGTWTSPTTYAGPLFVSSGPAANGPFDPNQVTRTQVGSGTLQFSDANDGIWSYTVNGISGSEPITRQPY
jgi:hypothetical protein